LIRGRSAPLGVAGQKAPIVPCIGIDAIGQAKISDRQQAQARLLECLFESTLIGVLLDRHFNVLRASKSYADACGRTIEEVTGRNHFAMHPSDVRADFEQVLSSGKAHSARAQSSLFSNIPSAG
jgi:PAS domain S-box-containing protein